MHELATVLPKDQHLYYASQDMRFYRTKIDDIVRLIARTDKQVYDADFAFNKELSEKEKALQSIMGNYYKKRLEQDGIFKERMTGAVNIGSIQTIDQLRWDYKRRLGNVVLRKIRYIQTNTYSYSKNIRHKTNDKRLKVNIAMSGRKINRELNQMFDSVLQWFLPETNIHSNRLREIENEMQAEHQQELAQQVYEEATPVKSKYYYSK
jgi:hypothetical protein